MVSAIALAPQRSKINALQFSPSRTNPQLAIGGNDTAITAWNALNGQFYNIFTCIKAQEVLELNYTTSLEWIKNSSKLISGHTSGKINLWDINNCTINLELSQHKAAVLSIKMNPQMNTLASGGYDKLLFFWDINVCKPDFYLQSLCSPISSIDFSFDGMLCGTSGYNSVCRIFDISSQLIAFSIFRNSNTKYIDFSFSPNSLYAAAITDTGCVEIWDLRNQKLLKNINKFKYRCESTSTSVKICVTDTEFKAIGYCSENKSIECFDLTRLETKTLVLGLNVPRLLSYSPDFNKCGFVSNENPSQAFLIDSL